MKRTPICWILLMFSSVLPAGDAVLHVSPNMSQFFNGMTVSVTCKDLGISEGWKVYMNSSSGLNLPVCFIQRPICTIDSMKSSDSGIYWCQSDSGEHITVNITVHGGLVILQSPALPVIEGHHVTLSCRYRKDKGSLESLPCPTAGFYKDGSLIKNGTTGEMTIPTVNRSDDGLWMCRCGNYGESPESRMTVTGATSSPTPVPSPTPAFPEVSMSLSRLLCSLLVVSPYLMVTTVLMVKYSRNRRRTQA